MQNQFTETELKQEQSIIDITNAIVFFPTHVTQDKKQKLCILKCCITKALR